MWCRDDGSRARSSWDIRPHCPHAEVSTPRCCHLQLLQMASAHPCSFQPQVSFCLLPWGLHLTSMELTQPAHKAAKACWIETPKNKVWQQRAEVIVWHKPVLCASVEPVQAASYTALRSSAVWPELPPGVSHQPIDIDLSFSHAALLSVLPLHFLRIDSQIHQHALSWKYSNSTNNHYNVYEDIRISSWWLVFYFSTEWVHSRNALSSSGIDELPCGINFSSLFLTTLWIEPRAWQTLYKFSSNKIYL